MRHAERLGLPGARRRALDFGCGVGRVTQGLARHFERCDGVDVAASMLERARALNALGERCVFTQNAAPDLALYPDESFDLVYSGYVLQHLPPESARRYLGELVRVLAKGGLLFVQMTCERVPPAPSLLADALRARLAIEAPPEVAAGALADVRVRVTNASAHVWPAGALFAGNHWRSASGELLVNDDGRSRLDGAVAPGASAELTLTVTAPPEPGAYALEVDLVEEGVAWLAERGSPPARVEIAVTASGSPPVAFGTPRMEMHGIHHDEVTSLLTGAGARFLELLEPPSYGHEFLARDWVSHAYAATKS
jgi:SAM-dependent methyltransferase